MSSMSPQRQIAALKRGNVISAAAELAGLQAPDGSMVSSESLGPGIVEQFGQDGRVCVHWVGAGFDTCLDPTDVRPLGQDAHLVSIYRRDKRGETRLAKHVVVANVGLQHNWTVELLPDNTIRVIRNTDGCSWVFGFNWIFKRIDVWWSQPPRDDDAEALVVAEAATRDKH